MQAEIFLVAPMTADTNEFTALLPSLLDATPVAALLLPRGERDDAAYRTLCETVLPVAQSRDCALLIDNDPELARQLGADGVHMSAGIKAFQEALDLLKPDMIVGAGNIHSRHDAMTKGEAGADYLFFGPLTGPADPDARASAEWWAETFEVPAVYCDPAVDPARADAAGCEFVGLSESVWSAPDGAAAALSGAAKSVGVL